MTEGINIDELLRALSLLTALRGSIDDPSITEYHCISESHVDGFHNILSSISATGIDVPEFYIPASDIKPRLTGSSSSGKKYSEEKYVRKSIFVTKLDGIINYLNCVLEKPERTTGFKLPR